MSRRTRQIESKEFYHELTDKMKAIVDAVVENPDAADTKIAEIASEKLEDDSVSHAYVPVVKEAQSHIIDQRLESKDNERYQGSETTEGDPFQGQIIEKKDWQTLAERPIQGSVNGNEETNGDEETETEVAIEDEQESEETHDGYTIALGKSEIKEMLVDNRVPQRIREELLEETINRAF